MIPLGGSGQYELSLFLLENSDFFSRKTDETETFFMPNHTFTSFRKDT